MSITEMEAVLDRPFAREAIVLFSGGIDSTACIYLLKEQGFLVRGLFVDYSQAAAHQESQAVLGAARENHITSLASRGAGPSFASNSRVLQMFGEFPDTSTLEICEEDTSDSHGLFGVDDEFSLHPVVALGHMASHPHALLLRGGDFVSDPFARDLTLELREGEKHVESQTAHGGSRIELLRNGDEAYPLLIKGINYLGEVGQRASEAVCCGEHPQTRNFYVQDID